MIRLNCKARNWHWGKPGLDSLVGKSYLNSTPELLTNSELYAEADKERYAELWIGDHHSNPVQVSVDSSDL